MLDSILRKSSSILWALLLVLLPITSMPLVRDLVHSTVVASPSVLVLALLVLVWLLPFILKGGKLPGLSVPLLAFVGAAVLSSAAALFIDIPPFKDHVIWKNMLQAFIPLGIGLCYYLIAARFPQGEDGLRASLVWIYLGGALILAWSLVQAAAWFGLGHYPDRLRDIQDWFSLGPLYRQRVTGFALEPSWLAHQLNMLYLPLWLAATVRRYSVFRWRVLGLTLENFLLAGGVLILGLSFSRVGFLAFLAMVSLLFVWFNIWLVRRVRAWLVARASRRSGRPPSGGRLLSAGLISALLVVYLGVLVGGLFAFSRLDPRMADVFKYSYWKDAGFLAYANQLQFGERAVYWQAGWGVFDRYPLLGVGLGNVGYYFPDTMPAYGWQMVEVRRLMFRAVDLPNAKNLWVRLLSETGILGFAFFLAWLYSCAQAARALQSTVSSLNRTLALAGFFVLAGLIFEGFSIDSFALPYFWISLGLLAAAARSVESLVPGAETNTSSFEVQNEQ